MRELREADAILDEVGQGVGVLRFLIGPLGCRATRTARMTKRIRRAVRMMLSWFISLWLLLWLGIDMRIIALLLLAASYLYDLALEIRKDD